MDNSPAISVVVPMYKVEQYIKVCVDSILSQTFQDFEIILVDDASPDGCVELYQKLYGDNDKVRLVRHEKNLGLGPARNTGIKHSRGKYVYFVDSDDLILPDALEKFFTAAEKNNAQVVHANRWYVLSQNEPEPILQENLSIRRCKYSQKGFIPFDPIYRMEHFIVNHEISVTTWVRFCRRDFLLEKQIEFLPVISEDMPFAVALYCSAERYYIMREAVYVYRKRKGSIMRTHDLEKFSKIVRSCIRILRYVKGILDNIPRFENYEQWRRSVLYDMAMRCAKHHTIHHFKDSAVAPEINETAEKIFTEIFGDDAYFVKFFFLHYHTYRRQAENLTKQVEQFKAQQQNIVATFIREHPGFLELMASVRADGKRILLLHTPRHGNIGDQAIVLGEMRVLKEFFPEHKIIEVPTEYFRGDNGELLWGIGFETYVRRDDIIFLPGGGNLGNLWLGEEKIRRELIQRFAQNKIVSFPQSIHFTDDAAGRAELATSQKIYGAHPDLHLMMRDENSFDFATKNFPSAKNYLLPDSVTVLLGITDDCTDARQGVLFVLRSDKEKIRDDKNISRLQKYLADKNIPFTVTDTVIGGRVTSANREKKVREVLMKFRRSKLVVTDRFHGVVFSFVTRTPVMAFKSFDTKISSGIRWFRNIPSIFYAEGQDWSRVENFIDTYYFAAAEENFPAALNCKIETDGMERFIHALNQIVRASEVAPVVQNTPPRLPEHVDNDEPRRLTVDAVEIVRRSEAPPVETSAPPKIFNKADKFVECLVPISHCNLHCEYCYVIQGNYRDSARPEFRRTPQEIGQAFNPARWDAKHLFVSFCGAGETFLCKEMTDIVACTLQQGNFVNVTNNGTISRAIETLTNLPDDLASRLVFAFSFHYNELKNRNLLDTFAANVKKVIASKASFTVQLNLYDGYLPCLDEIKNFCMENFGALPQLALTRDQRRGMKLYTAGDLAAYRKLGADFHSPMFEFSCDNFLVNRAKNFCYAGQHSWRLNLATGALRQCYSQRDTFNAYDDLEQKIPLKPVGRHCGSRYCINAIHFMALGNVPEVDCPSYAQLRDRPEAGWYKQTMIDALGGKFLTDDAYKSQD